MEVRASLGEKRHSSPPPRRARLPLPDRQSHKEDEVWAQSCCCAPRSPKRWTAHPRLGTSWKGCCCSCPHDESACKYSLILHEGGRFLLRSSAVRARGQGSRLDRRCSSPVPLSPPSLSRGRGISVSRSTLRHHCSPPSPAARMGCKGVWARAFQPRQGPAFNFFFSAARAFHLAECLFFAIFCALNRRRRLSPESGQT